MPRKKKLLPLDPAKIQIFQINEYKKKKNVANDMKIFLFFKCFSFF